MWIEDRWCSLLFNLEKRRHWRLVRRAARLWDRLLVCGAHHWRTVSGSVLGRRPNARCYSSSLLWDLMCEPSSHHSAMLIRCKPLNPSGFIMSEFCSVFAPDSLWHAKLHAEEMPNYVKSGWMFGGIRYHSPAGNCGIHTKHNQLTSL